MAITQNIANNFDTIARYTWATGAHFGYKWADNKTSGNRVETVIPTLSHVPYPMKLTRIILGWRKRSPLTQANPPFIFSATGLPNDQAPDGFDTSDFIFEFPTAGNDAIIVYPELWTTLNTERYRLMWTVDVDLDEGDDLIATFESLNTTNITNLSLPAVNPALAGWWGPQEVSVQWLGYRKDTV
jgi:hypothetical protein